MKLFHRNLPLILLASALFFFTWQGFSSFRDQKTKVPVKGYNAKISASTYRSFVVIVTGHDAHKGWQKSFRSIFEQEYPHCRIIYLEEGLNDQVNRFLLDENPKTQVEILYDGGGEKSLENIYRAIHSCRDDEVVVFLDGRDWLAHDLVLHWINLQYEDFTVWMTYGSSINYPTYKKGRYKKIRQEVLEKRSFREEMRKGMLFSPLRTAYAGLLKRVRLEDFLTEEGFVSGDEEQTFFLPALEMAGLHCRHIPEILYVSNRGEGGSKQERLLWAQLFYGRHTEQISPYSPISSWERKAPSVDIVLDLGGVGDELSTSLASIRQFVTGYQNIWIVGDPPESDEGIPPNAHFVSDKESLKKAPADFFFSLKGESSFSEPLDLSICAFSCADTGFNMLFLGDAGEKRWQLNPSIAVTKREEEVRSGQLIEKGAFFHEGRRWRHALSLTP